MIKIKKFFNIILMLYLLFCFSLQNIHAFDIINFDNNIILNNNSFDIVPDNNGNFIIANYDNNTKKTTISYLNTIAEAPELQILNIENDMESYSELSYRYNTINYNNNALYISHINDSNTLIEKYKLEKNNLIFVDKFSMDQKIKNSNQFAINKYDYIFTIDTNDCKSIDILFNGKSINKISSDDETFTAISSDISKENIYALTNSNKLFKYHIYSEELIKTEITFNNCENNLSDGFKFLSDTIIITNSGKIYNFNNDKTMLNQCTKNIDLNYKSILISIAAWNNSLVITPASDTILNTFDIQTGSVAEEISLDKKIIAISTSGNKTIAITESNSDNNNLKSINIISEQAAEQNEEDDTTKINENMQKDNDNQKINNSNQNEATNNTKQEDNPESKQDYILQDDKQEDNSEDKIQENSIDDGNQDIISSNVHFIDYENKIISDININTTLSEFKNAIIFNLYNISIKNSNGSLKKGNLTKVGTGDVVTFSRDGTSSISFTLIVTGDLTGSGTITSSDINYMVNHILGKAPLEGIYLKAADINKDGSADSIDLLLMYKIMQK